MKKTLFLLLGLLIANLSWAQTYVNEDFSGGTLPAGWTSTDLQGSGAVWEFNNPGSQTGVSPISNPFAIIDSDNWGSIDINAALDTPSFDASARGAILDFDYYFRECCGAEMFIEVFNGTSWVQVYTSSSTSSNPDHLSLDISTAIAGATNAKVRFRYTGNWDWYWMIDNIVIAAPPICQSPIDLAVTPTSLNDANISWTASPSSPAGYEYAVSTSATPPASGTPTANTSVTGVAIQPSVQNYLHVRSDCGVDGFSDWASYSFMGPVPGQIGAPDYPANLPIYSCYGYNYSQQLYFANEVNVAVSGGTHYINKIRFYYDSNSATSTANWDNWTIYMANTSKTEFASDTDWIPSSALTQVFSGALSLPSVGNWMEITLNTGFMWDGTSNLVIAVDENVSGYNCTAFFGAFDDPSGRGRSLLYYSDGTNPDPASPPTANGWYLTANALQLGTGTPPACLAPTAVTVTGLGQSTADIAWTAGATETAWNVSWGLPGFTPGVDQIDTKAAASTSYQITGLSPNTAYEVYVQADCVSDQSTWVGPVAFRTACAPFGDFTENFDTTTVGEVPSCWNSIKVNSTSSFATIGANTTSGPLSSPNHLRFYNSGDSGAEFYLVSPSLTDLSSADHQMRFSYKGYANTSLTVGTMSDPTDALTFTPVKSLSTTTTYDEYIVVFDQSYTDAYIAFKVSFAATYEYSYLDDVYWEPIPTCPAPTDLTVDSFTHNSATLSWTDNASASQYLIKYDTPGFDPNTQGMSASGNSTGGTLTGLTPSTTYEFYVQAQCGGGDGDSRFGGPITFTTKCAPVTTPWTYDVEGQTGTGKNALVSGCWTANPTSGFAWNVSNSNTVSSSTGPSAANSGTKFFFTEATNGSTGAIAELTSPQINLSGLTTPALNFYYHMYGADITALKVYVFDGTAWNLETTITGQQQSSSTDAWKDITIVLAGYTGIIEVKFEVTRGAGYAGDVAIDDISIVEAPACTKPIDLTVSNLDITTADMSWTTTASVSDIYVTLSGDPAPNASSTPSYNDVTSPTTLTSLSPNTSYDVYVRSDCALDGVSDWAGPISFTTLCSFTTVPYVLDFETVTVPDLPACTTIETINGKPWKTSSSASGFTGKVLNYPYHPSGTGLANSWFYTQGIQLNAGTAYQISYKYSNKSTFYTESMKVAYGTSPDASSMTNPLTDHPSIKTNDVLNGQATFTVPANGVYYFGFNSYSMANQNQLYVDDINIDEFAGYAYIDGDWLPSDPSGVSGLTDDIIVVNGTTSLNADTDVNNLSIESGATLEIKHVLNLFGDIVNNGNLVFVSTATGNGELGEITGTSTITGNATVQRYMSSNRSYRMVSSAVTTTTSIHDNWQEGATCNTCDPHPTFGTHITGRTVDQEDGFDGTATGNPSMFTVDVSNQQFVEVPQTNGTATLSAGKAYLMFVRGSRAINLGDNSAEGSTTLRATGALYTGSQTQTFAATPPAPNNFVMFGNPYQSTVDVKEVFANTNTTNINPNQYYVYDPTLGSHGAYVTVDLVNNTNNGGFANEFLQPGQGAQVATMAAGVSSIEFTEDDKAPGNFTVTNANGGSGLANMLAVQLYTTDNFNNGGPLHDGLVMIFGDGLDNGITPMDAVKPMNFYENLGIDHNGTYLSLERREMPIPAEMYQLYTAGYSDTAYTLKLAIDGLDATNLYLEDRFTGTSTLLNTGETTYSFTVDAGNAQSIAADRFYIRTAERLGVDENNLLAGIRLFPNPLNADTFYINAPRLNGEQLMVSISDLSGRRIFDQTLECRANTVTVPMGSEIASGVYLVTLKHGGESHTLRLIKE